MKIGIEIHQRLETNKLFCPCPGRLSGEKTGDLVMSRRLHPVLSELGEIDEASKVEHEKERYFEYHVFRESDCPVETDEEPPHRMNSDALGIALGIALQLNAAPVDEVHVMRKMVIDGSNTSGFQRTAIVALNGYVDTSKGRVGITQVALEEESAGIIESTESKVSYSLDRLGIPLVEISTAPDIKDPEHLYEVAETIGMMLRATGKVARGIGTIRQDVNVSTDGGARVEIKGAQELKLLPVLVEQEAGRQQELIKLAGEMKQRFGGEAKIPREFHDVTDAFQMTASNIVRNALKRGERVFAMKLPLHAGMLGREIQVNRRYGSELSDYAKLAGVQGIIHSDEDFGRYGVEEAKRHRLNEKLSCGGMDAFVLVLAKEEKAKKALEKVAERCEMASLPEETRRANIDGSTSFMRPLPGRARMYPETDILPVAIAREMLAEARAKAGEPLKEKREKLSRLLGREMAESMLRSRNLALFEKLVERGVDAVLAFTTLENTLVSLRREGVEPGNPEAALSGLFDEYAKGTFAKAAIPGILKEMAKGKTVLQAVDDRGLRRITGDELRKVAEENDYDVAKIMQQYRLRIEPKDLEGLKKKG